MAWQYERNLSCSGCGMPRDETTDPANQFAYRARPIRCHACKAQGDARHEFTAGAHDLSGITFSVREVE